MNQRLILFLLALLIILSPAAEGVGQSLHNTKEEIRIYVEQLPSGAEKNATHLAEALTQPWSDDWQKAYAIYYWTANNIDYDLRLSRNPGTFDNAYELIEHVLKKGSGVCQHYAELFNYMAERAGIETVVIGGYTKQNNHIHDLPHAWNAAKLDGEWFLFDATWASGYMDGTKVRKRFTDDYFMVQPEQMIKTHMPFDPLFQFLQHPLSNEDFYRGNYRKPSLDKMDYRKKIATYFALDKEAQLRQSIQRMEEAGIINDMILQEANLRIENLNILMKNQQVDVHNRAVDLFNQAVKDFNYYLKAKNNHFRNPKMSDEEILQILQEVESNVLESKALFQQVKATEEMLRTINKNYGNLNDLLRQLEKEQEFARKYTNTAKALRPFVR